MKFNTQNKFVSRRMHMRKRENNIIKNRLRFYSLFSTFEEGVEFNRHFTAQRLTKVSHGAVRVD